MGSIVDSIYADKEVSADSWKQETDSKQTGPKGEGLSFISFYYLKKEAPNNVGLVSFLSDRLTMWAYEILDPYRMGKNIRLPILKQGDNCPLARAGYEPKRYVAYALIDWLHQYKSKSGEIIKQPTFKLFYKGIKTYEVFERRRQKFGTLVGRNWEVTRQGEGYQSYYDIMPEKEHGPIDFSQKKTITGKDRVYEVPLIAMPDGWPEYEDTVPENEQSVYTRKRLKPDRPIDWNNKDDVNDWIKLWFLTVPQSVYTSLAAMKGSAPATAKAEPARPQDDDTPW